MIDPKRSAGVTLRIKIDNEHGQSAECEGSRHVHTRCGLAYATLLVCDDEDSSMCRCGQFGGRRTGSGDNGRRIILDRRCGELIFIEAGAPRTWR
jgi:hypothetical protein